MFAFGVVKWIDNEIRKVLEAGIEASDRIRLIEWAELSRATTALQKNMAQIHEAKTKSNLTDEFKT